LSEDRHRRDASMTVFFTHRHRRCRKDPLRRVLKTSPWHAERRADCCRAVSMSPWDGRKLPRAFCSNIAVCANIAAVRLCDAAKSDAAKIDGPK
jgi:hypothetical protein